MRTWKCPSCGREVRIGYEQLAEIGTPICGQPDCPDPDHEMTLLPEPASRGMEVHLIVPSGKKDVQSVVAVLEKAGRNLCQFLGRPKDRFRVAVNPSKPQIRLIVEMHGGTIEGVYQDSPDVRITDIVFTEDGKYLEGEEDRDEEGDLRFAVESGALKGLGIYTHQGEPEVAGPDLFEPVMCAAARRIQAARKERKKP